MDWMELTRFLYITARVSGFVLFNPLLGRRNVPGIVRAGLVLVLAVALSGVAGAQGIRVPGTLVELSVHALMELALGFLLGLVMNFFFYIPVLAGEVIDTQMGMSMAKIYDAGAQASMSMTSTLLTVLMTVLFFAANGHHTLIRILLTSGEVVPFGGVHLGNAAVNAVLQMFIECTVLAVKLCMPVLAAELIGEVGMGILMKVIPQINVFAINIELKVLIGLVLVFLLLAPFSEFLLEAERTMLSALREILPLSG